MQIKTVYLPNKGGWFWTVREGNRVEYYGPFPTRYEAEKRSWVQQTCFVETTE